MHEPSANFHILSECQHGYIGVCSCCRNFNFAYKNIVLSFTEDEMFRFCHWLIDSADNPDNCMPLHHGRDRIYTSPLSNLYLAFSLREIKEITRLAAEAELLLEARRLVLSK